MNTQIFGPLYAKASTGKIKTWKITVVEEGQKVTLNTLHGYINGKKSSSTKIIKGKNIGKANETSPWNQALSDAQSKVNKKTDEGYRTTVEELEGQTLLLPMLAHPYTKRKHNIEWPAYVQPKLNGVRCIATMTEDGPEYISRKGKKYNTLDHLNEVVEELSCAVNYPLDGEIFHPEWGFQEIIRALKKDRGWTTDLLQYWVYDIVAPDLTFEERKKLIDTNISVFNDAMAYEGFGWKCQGLLAVSSIEVNSEEKMLEWHKKFTDMGYEGTIIRNKKGLYELKNRSKDLQKYKDFLDAEYTIIGGKEASGNDEGTVIFICALKDNPDATFSVRPKGSRETRKRWLTELDSIIGKQLTVRYQEVSEEGIPIFPVGIAIRDYED